MLCYCHREVVFYCSIHFNTETLTVQILDNKTTVYSPLNSTVMYLEFRYRTNTLITSNFCQSVFIDYFVIEC